LITGELKNKVDKLWEMFWTGGLTNPLDVIEQITYLMFIRDLDNTNFIDDILSDDWNELQPENDDLANYKKKVIYYILQHQEIPAIANLKTNIPLTPDDLRSLENILWNRLGTKEQYETQYMNTQLEELIRSIVGLNIKAANDAFSVFQNNERLLS